MGFSALLLLPNGTSWHPTRLLIPPTLLQTTNQRARSTNYPSQFLHCRAIRSDREPISAMAPLEKQPGQPLLSTLLWVSGRNALAEVKHASSLSTPGFDGVSLIERPIMSLFFSL